MKYYIIAGEASGDLNGSNLIKKLREKDTEAVIRCWGGDLMEQAGAELVMHYKKLAFMGFWEVVSHLNIILRNFKFAKKDISIFDPDVLILIDYPGFNLKMAGWAHKRNIRTVYYISPQVWAWKEGRVKNMKRNIDKMLVILPFEKEYFKSRWNWEVCYVGHPLLEVTQRFLESASKEKQPSEHKIIALLPGSRKQEITRKLPVMLRVSQKFPDYKFIVAQAPGTDDSFYEPFMAPYDNVEIVKGGTYKLLNQSIAALVTSGTATLETALLGVPEVVCYKGSNISYQIAKHLVKIKYISLVNLIMGRTIVMELIQRYMNEKNLEHELSDILFNDANRNKMLENYKELKEKLYRDKDASERAAEEIMQLLSEPQGEKQNHPQTQALPKS